jgi:hypothetical protein
LEPEGVSSDENFLKKIWIFLIVLVLAGSSNAQTTQTFLYLLYDGGKVGEKNQVHGITQALKEYLPKDTVQKEFELKDKEAFLANIQENLFKEDSKNKGIILAAEVGGIDVLSQLKPQKNIVIAHSSHQFTKEHSNLKDAVDIVALPQYVVTGEVLKAIESPDTTLIQTAGVPHNLSPKAIEEAFENNKGIIPVAPKYLGVILGGDAETPERELRFYTAKEAEELASFIASQIKEKQSHLLILNGPRTGKHDQSTGKVIETSHRDGSLDAVTAAFKGSLLKEGLIEGKNFTIFDFQFGKTSVYPVVLGALLKTKSPIFVAGESTSMVSETADCLPKGLVTAFAHNAMNENHRKHCQSEKEAGRINILENTDGNWHLLEANKTSDSKDSRPASQIIAEAIKKRFEEKFL